MQRAGLPVARAASDFRLAEEPRVSTHSILTLLAALALLMAATLAVGLLRLRRRAALLRELHVLADRQETVLRGLRAQLDAVHAEIDLLTDQSDVRRDAPALAAAMREHLAHRLWLRDRSAQAPLAELRATRAAWRTSVDTLQNETDSLREAQSALHRASQSAIGH